MPRAGHPPAAAPAPGPWPRTERSRAPRAGPCPPSLRRPLGEEARIAAAFQIVAGRNGPLAIREGAGPHAMVGPAGDIARSTALVPRHARHLDGEALVPQLGRQPLGVLQILEEAELHPVASLRLRRRAARPRRYRRALRRAPGPAGEWALPALPTSEARARRAPAARSAPATGPAARRLARRARVAESSGPALSRATTRARTS